VDSRVRIAEEIARDMTRDDLARLGPEFHMGIRNDPQRGKILDVVRNDLVLV
jgi:hypothetical protein